MYRLAIDCPGYARDSTVLFSGGLDSLIGWWEVALFQHDVDASVLPLLLPLPLAPSRTYVDVGHRYARAEKSALWRIMRVESELFGLEVPMTPALGVDLSRLEAPSAHIPARNLYLALAAAWGGAHHIWLVVQRDEMTTSDRSPEFFRRATLLLSLLFPDVTVVRTPFANLDKTDMVARFLARLPRDAAERLLRASWSCYEGGSYPVHCGACKACVRRFIALSLNGVEEEYRVLPSTSEVAREYVRAAHAAEYSPRRCLRILGALSGGS